jgi:hypothetical protein
MRHAEVRLHSDSAHSSFLGRICHRRSVPLTCADKLPFSGRKADSGLLHAHWKASIDQRCLMGSLPLATVLDLTHRGPKNASFLRALVLPADGFGAEK